MLSMNKYRSFISSRLLGLEDDKLRKFDSLEKFTEAFIQGWRVWKKRDGEEALQTFCTVMLSN